MKESSTYQAILAEGEAQGLAKGEKLGAVAEARKVLRLLGDEAFGLPDAPTAALIDQLDDLPRLEGMLRRLHTAGSWQELIHPPAAARRGGRRRT
jgi:hypothetical protein